MNAGRSLAPRVVLAQVAIVLVSIAAVLPLVVAYPAGSWIRSTVPVVIGVFVAAIGASVSGRRGILLVGGLLSLLLALVLDGGFDGILGAFTGWRRFLTQAIPFPDEPGYRSIATVLAFAAVAPALWASQLRYRATGVIIAPVIVYGMAFAFTRPEPLTFSILAAFPASVLILLAFRSSADLDDVEDLSETSRGIRLTRQIGVTLVSTVVLVAIGAIVTGLYFTFVGSPTELNPREQVEPNEDTTSLPNPLEQASVWRFLNASDPAADPATTRIASFDFGRSASSAEDGPIRLAVLDAADQSGFTSTETYARTTGGIPAPTIGPAASSQEPRQVRVVVQPVAQPWFPTVGAPVGIEGVSGPAFDPATSTVITSTPAEGAVEGIVSYRPQPFEPEEFIDSGVDQQVVEATEAPCPAVDVVEAARQLDGVLVGDVEGVQTPVSLANEVQEKLLAVRPFDPRASGGTQSVAAIVSDFATNSDAFERTPSWPLETTIAAGALALRCARDIPARVAVGLLEYDSGGDGVVEVGFDNITAWVEVPVEDGGWVPVRLEPSGQELQIRNEAVAQARSDRANAPPEPVVEEPQPQFVPGVVEEGRPVLRRLAVLAAAVGSLLAGWTLVAWAVRRLTLRRRRRLASPAAAVGGAWTTVHEMLAARGVDSEGLTVRDLVVTCDAVLGPRTAIAAARVVPVVDRALYSDLECTDDQAGRVWSVVEVADAESGRRGRVTDLRHWMGHPVSLVRSWAGARSQSTRRNPYVAEHQLAQGEPISVGGLRDLAIETQSVVRSVASGVDSAGQQRSVFVLNDVPLDVVDDPEVVQRLRLAASVSSRRGLLRISRDTSVTDSGAVCLVGDPLPGPSLESRVAAGESFQPDRVALLLDQLAESVGGLHVTGIVHGAIDPGNVWLDHVGRPVLGPVAVTPSLVALGRRPFVSVWSAPEVIAGDPVSVQSDVHQLGTLGRLLLMSGRSDSTSDRPEALTLVPLDPLLRATDLIPSRRWRNVEQFRAAVASYGLAGTRA